VWFGNKVPRKFRKLYAMGLQSFYLLCNILVLLNHMLKFVGYSACTWETRNEYNIIWGNGGMEMQMVE
jgi:hypothetical protein